MDSVLNHKINYLAMFPSLFQFTTLGSLSQRVHMFTLTVAQCAIHCHNTFMAAIPTILHKSPVNR